MNKIELLASRVLPILLLGITACSRYQPTVVVIPRTTATPLWESLHVGVAETARGNGLHVYWNAPSDERDSQKQLSLIVASADQHPLGVIFAPDERLASRSAILQLSAKHIPAVIIDDESGPPTGPLLSYVTNDEDAGADMAAQQIATILRGQGSIAITGISGALESNAARENSFEAALARRAPNVHVVARRFGDSVVAHEQRLAQEVLNNSSRVDAIVALSGSSTRGAFLAKLADDSHANVPIVGFDQDSLLPIQIGCVNAIIAQDTRTIGQLALKNLEAQIRGHGVSGITKVSPVLLTKETLNSPQVKRLWEFTRYQWSSQ
jgi:ribose transport system substrate-binding protein